MYVNRRPIRMNSHRIQRSFHKINLKSLKNGIDALNFRDFPEVIRKGFIKNFKLEQPAEEFECNIYVKGEMTIILFLKRSERVTELLDLNRKYVCGPMRVLPNGRAKYFV